MQWWVVTHLPSGRFPLASYSWLVMSSMVWPVEEVFRSVGAVPLSIGKAGLSGGKMATLWWLWSKFPPLLTLLPPGPLVSHLIEEVMTSIKQSSHSKFRVGGAHSMALSLGLAEDSSASCLLAGGSSTQLKMVVWDGQWAPLGSSILRPSITSSRVISMNSQMACLNISHTFS